MANIYGNATDLANAQKYLANTPGLNFIDTSKGGTYTPGQGDYVVGGAGATGGLANAGQAQRLWGADANATAKAIQDASGGIMRDSYAGQLTNIQNQLLVAKQQEKANALRSAYENNSQALNSQQNSVNNAYTSAINSINATKQAQLPQYQQQRNAASADAAQMAQKVRELMAATGRYNSGMNRSQQLAVELGRQQAISGANAAENQFNTQIGNQLSDAERNKASSLSDIAQKLALLQNQYNQGTLDLNNQIASEKAAAASKALLDAQTWADQQRQQGINNDFRQGQFDYQKTLDAWNQQFQQGQADRNYGIDVAQLLGTYNGSPTLGSQQLQLQRDEMNANNAYRNAALARSSSGSSSANLSALKYQNELGSQQALARSMQGLQNMASNGKTRSELLSYINSNAADLQANGVPVQDLYGWAAKNFTWDKNSNGDWYDTSAK